MSIQPASSGRAAQLLEASGGFQTGFVGFDSLSGDLGYVPASSQASGEAAECGDGELRMVMKRLTKKDAVTKLKVGFVVQPATTHLNLILSRQNA